MSKHAALQDWLDDRLPLNGELPLDSESQRLMYEGRYLARAAWHAAVKHTLKHVASELRACAVEHYSTDLVIAKDALREQACRVLKMKP